MKPYRFIQGAGPVLVSVPHAGVRVPDEILARFTPEARLLPDTDWHVDRLYDFAGALGCSVLAADYSRYVIDLNRPPDDENLYPGQNTTGLIPIDTFDERPIYVDDCVPDMAETFGRVDGFWTPYHEALQAEMSRLVEIHGFAVLWEAHSIRSEVPRLFEGRLPDLNFGTAAGASCAPALADALAATAERAGAAFSQVWNGRFKGGYTTRQYGRPAKGWHAVQLELAQDLYMDETPPFSYRADKAERLRPALRALLETAQAWRP